jgi:predicted HTH domain antitoxin
MSMTVTIELPPEVERALGASEREAGLVAKEALAVSLFRQGKLSHAELGRALGLDRFETDALLKRHQVVAGSLSLADLEADRSALEQALGPVRR